VSVPCNQPTYNACQGYFFQTKVCGICLPFLVVLAVPKKGFCRTVINDRARYNAPLKLNGLRGIKMLVGYVRVSTNDQNTALQRNALECAGCELIFEDKISGKTSERPGLKKLLKTLSEGDTLIVWKLDRLGRSMRHLVTLIEELRQRGINFRSLTDSIDTSTPMGRFFFHVMGALAEMERELIVERTRAGLDAARAQGRIGGRRPKLTAEQWAQAGRLIAAGESRQRVALIFDVGLSTLYRKFPA